MWYLYIILPFVKLTSNFCLEFLKKNLFLQMEVKKENKLSNWISDYTLYNLLCDK